MPRMRLDVVAQNFAGGTGGFGKIGCRLESLPFFPE